MKVFLARFSQTADVVAGFHACLSPDMVYMVAYDPNIHRRCDCAKKRVGAEIDHYGITWVGAETDHYGITR